MYFIIDGILIGIMVLIVVFGIRKGFTGHFIFNILRTVLAFACGAGAAVGAYFLMESFGWLDFMKDGVISFFGNITNTFGGAITQDSEVVGMIFKIIAFLPFGILALVLGYIIGYYLLGLIMKFITVPLAKLRKYTAWRVIDNILGTVVNFAILGAVVLAVFGAVHALNQNGKQNAVLGEDTPAEFANHSIEVVLTTMHENISAAPLGGLIYEYNPLNGMFAEMFGSAN